MKYHLNVIILVNILTIAPIFITCSGSKTKPLESDFESMKALVDYAVPHFLDNNRKALQRALISKKQYIEAIHPLTPEGSAERGAISGEDKWRIFTGPRRGRGIVRNTTRYANKDYKYAGFEQAKQVLEFGPLKLHRRVPVKLRDPKTGKIIRVTTIMAVVAEKNGKFKLLNVFDD